VCQKGDGDIIQDLGNTVPPKLHSIVSRHPVNFPK
jgi:hypothetical protein